MRRTVEALAIVLFCPVLAQPQSALTPEDVLRWIAESGARSVVANLYEDYSRWRELLLNIGMGDAAWLRVAVALRPGSDAGTTDMLDLAVGEALEHQPRSVLEIAVPALGIECVCGGPDVDDERYDSYELSINAIEVRKRMLGAVSDAHLATARDRCIAALEEAKVGIARFYGVGR
jgi:hypothetical protein